MKGIRRNGRRAALPAALAVVVIAIAVAALFGGQITPPPRWFCLLRKSV